MSHFLKLMILLACSTLALAIQPTWSSMTADLNALSAFAVEYRYPGDSADLDEAKEAFQRCTNLRQIFREALHK